MIAVIKRQADVKQDELRVEVHELLHDILKILGDACLAAPRRDMLRDRGRYDRIVLHYKYLQPSTSVKPDLRRCRIL